ncbi:EthD family reductase [Marivita hallyeonensis]|uniref:EthD domain-containing protein n=1 Tax=Marivita hallyeonensis TaxID=996342 RepID=A0A1M5XEA8_9RHOB|nr:EthD family reductase [Marivita hallyeonensis]SHH97834.1 conserved hypothetical protein [Marivita hallyeonensis]
MPMSLQVIYPITGETNFDYDYYTSTHMDLVNTHMGPHIATTLVTRGLAGGPDAPRQSYAVATFTFSDKDALDAALRAAGPVIADIPKFTNTQPQMLIGEVIG